MNKNPIQDDMLENKSDSIFPSLSRVSSIPTSLASPPDTAMQTPSHSGKDETLSNEPGQTDELFQHQGNISPSQSSPAHEICKSQSSVNVELSDEYEERVLQHKMSHPYCFQAMSRYQYSNTYESDSSSSNLSGFNMDLYKKSQYYKPQPPTPPKKKDKDHRKETIVKMLEVT